MLRRNFIHTVLGAASAFAIPRFSRAQQTSVTTVAGTGVAGYETEGSAGLPATATPVNNPYGVVVGPDGALYFCEVNTGRTRRLEVGLGRLTTIAGSGESAYSGDAGPALRASFAAPHEIRFDADGHLFVVERDSHTVRRIDGITGIVSTLVGTTEAGYSGDGGAASAAQLRQPHSIAFDASGNLLICDIGNSRVRSIDMESGIITTLAGTGERVATPDSGPLSGTPLLGPRSLCTDPDGNAYLVLREGNAVYRLDLQGSSLRRIAGTGMKGYSGDGGAAIDASFNGPKGIAYSATDHSLYIVDTEHHVIRRLALGRGIIDSILGTGARGDGPDGRPLSCMLNRPHGVVVHAGVVYVTDSENHRIRAVAGVVS